MTVLGWVVFGCLAFGFFAALYQIFFKADGVHGAEIFFGMMILGGLISGIVLGLQWLLK